jgi:DNA modification methylase/isopentenyldiphosphate isomerase
MEAFQLVDTAGGPLGSAERSACHGNPALIHAVVHLHVLDRSGRLFLQRRSPAKDTNPGRWDTSVGGHVAAGEPVADALAREAREELGIDAAGARPLFTYLFRSRFESEFAHCFALVCDGPLRIDPVEIAEGRFFTFAEIEAMRGAGTLTPMFEHELPMLRQALAQPGPAAPGHASPRRMPDTTHAVVVADSSDLSFVADGSAALVVTSPPYPMIAMWDGHFRSRDPAIGRALDANDGAEAFELMHRDLDQVWSEVHRALCDGGIACINIGDAVRTLGGRFQLHPNHARILDAGRALGFEILPAVLWRKTTNAPNKFMGSGMLPAGAYVTLEHEYILVLRKNGRRLFVTPAAKARRRESAYFWEERNSWFSDVWDLRGARQALAEQGARQRSAAFPFEIAWRLILMHSVRGDTVLDPFLGTGTTVLAAMAAGRNSIGVEIDPAFEPVVRAAAAGLQDEANALIRARLAAHGEFVAQREREGRPPVHVNHVHGFPVMTAQEEDLVLEVVNRVEALPGGRFAVSYRTAGDPS